MGVKSYFQEGSRKEILGFMIIVFAVFVFISLASHDKLDIAKFERPVVEESPDYLISEGDYLNEEEYPNEDGTTAAVEEDRSLSFSELLDVHVANEAGLVGAAVSEYVLRVLGRSSFILTLVLMVIGWRLLFQYENNWLRNKLLEVFLFVFVLGTIFSLFDLDNPAISSTLTESLAGSIGWGLAKVSRSLFAVAGDSRSWAPRRSSCYSRLFHSDRGRSARELIQVSQSPDGLQKRPQCICASSRGVCGRL